MSQSTWLFLLLPIVTIIALVVGFTLQRILSDRRLGEAGARADRIIGDAQRDAETRLRTADLESKELILKARTDFDAEVRRREREVEQIEQRILNKEEVLARKLDDLERRLADYTSKDRGLVEREKVIVDKEGRLAVDRADEIVKATLLTIDGAVVNPALMPTVAPADAAAAAG